MIRLFGAAAIAAVAGALCSPVFAQFASDATPAAPAGILDPNFRPSTASPSLPATQPATAPVVAGQLPVEVQSAYQGGRYLVAAKLGAKALVDEPTNNALRLVVANSLAWSGRLDAAIEQYEKLAGTKLDSAGKIGVANIYRWRAKPVLAEPIYAAVLRVDPGNADALEGQKLAQRDMRLTVLKDLSYGKDSTGLSRVYNASSVGGVTADRSTRWRAGYGLGADRDALGRERYVELNGSIQGLDWPLSPRLDLSVSREVGKTRLYGLINVDILPDTFGIQFGAVNWGRLSFNRLAQAGNLKANRFGAYLNFTSLLGEARGRFDVYRVSDGNQVWDADLQLSPEWQPIPAGVSWYAGVSAKSADRVDPRYWSPVNTNLVGYLGIKKSWFFEKGDLAVGLQRGFKLSDDARHNYSVSANGKFWITDRMALGFEVGASDSSRATDYKQRFLGVQLQRLW